jgi:hypothetical protein
MMCIQFLTFHAPSFGLLLRYVEENQEDIFLINGKVSELAANLIGLIPAPEM